MIATIQRGIVLGLLLLALLAGWSMRSHGALAAFLAFAAVVLVYPAVLALEFVALGFINKRDIAPSATAGQLLGAWWSEVKAGYITFGWRQPFRAGTVPDGLDAAHAGRRGVVLVHGFLCNRGLWLPWYGELQRRGQAFAAVNLEPVFGSIDDYATLIDAAVQRVRDATGLAPVLVCHSMGGLAARAWLRRRRASFTAGAADPLGGRPPIAHVVTIGSPHHGTVFAHFGHGSNARQMRRLSDWQHELLREEADSRATLFTCWYSNGDNIVAPASSAMLPGADNRFLPGVGHVALALEPVLMAATLDLVAALPPDQPAT